MSENTYTIRQYEPDDRADFLSLHERVFGEPRDDAWFEWKYIENPYFEGVPMFVAEADGRVVGTRPFVTMPIQAGDRTHVGFQPSDTMVDPDHRRQGLFTRMTERSLEWLASLEGFDEPFCYNYPNENSRPGYLKLGWRLVGELTTYHRIETPSAFLGDDEQVGRLADLAGRGYLRATRATQRLPSGVSVEQRRGVPADTLVSLYDRAVPANLHAHRTPEFYRWRLGNPDWEYTTYLAARSGRPVVGAVVGIGWEDGARVARLTDVVPLYPDRTDIGCYRAILGTVVAAADVDVFSATGAAIPSDVLVRWGFLPDDRPPLSTVTTRRVMVARSIGTVGWTIDGRDIASVDDWHNTFIERDTS